MRMWYGVLVLRRSWLISIQLYSSYGVKRGTICSRLSWWVRCSVIIDSDVGKNYFWMSGITVKSYCNNYKFVISFFSDLVDSPRVSSFNAYTVGSRFFDIFSDSVSFLQWFDSSVYLSYPTSLPLSTLSSYLLTAFTAMDSLMHQCSMIPSCR